MPTQKVRARLRWKGKESVQEILARLDDRERMLLLLPAGFHHTVSVAVSGDRELHGPVDVALDNAAFQRLVRIRGLRALAELREPLADAAMDVRLRTPPPQILIIPQDRQRRPPLHCCSLPVALTA
jgi:hypothetical protein